jgi:peptidoglycan/xylan/chitin deacetylase (PgdA/CDA1 family)
VLFVRGARKWGRLRVALTFDDGPDAMTPLYLEALARLGVRATFFLVGENAARLPELAREYVRRGHDVGGHGYSHEPFCSMDAVRLAEDLAKTDAVVPHREGARRLVRPPLGALSASAAMQIAAVGYTIALWSLDSDDCRTTDPRRIAQCVAPERVSSGEVVLLHEMQPWTLQALPPIVDRLRSRGFEFVTVTELMR